MLPTEPTPSFPYRVLEKLGEGAMGEVFRAEDLELGRVVALKVVKPEFLASLPPQAAASVLQRFTQEARAAAALSHPGVTIVHRVGSEGGWPYIAMEWLDGRTLEALLVQQRRLSLEQAAWLGLQVLSVLDAAHRGGIVHRDIKPGNLFLTRDRRVKVTDFGIARVRGSSLAETQAGLVLGTPQYAAPEQLAGEAVDARADLFALGVVLFEAVTGAPPWEAETLFALLGKRQSAPLPVASTRVEGLPAAFDAFLARALASRRDERFSDAREMAAALQPFLSRPRPAETGEARASAHAATLAKVEALVLPGASPAALVAGVVRRWPATALGRQDRARLLERLLDKPLHAPAFCGAVELGPAILLACDGLLFGAFEPGGAPLDADLVLERLPAEVDATLYATPPGSEPRLVTLLGSLLESPQQPARPRLSGLDAAFVDVPQLVQKLAAEGFDGAVRLTRAGAQGVLLFSRGKRVLDLFGDGWPREPGKERWEGWLAEVGATVAVEDRAPRFPSLVYRRQLQDFPLRLVRPEPGAHGQIRSDTRAEAEALQLQPLGGHERASASDTTLQALLQADPAFALARWALVDLGWSFQQFQRTRGWKALLEPLARIEQVRLHASVKREDGRSDAFDVATLDRDGRLLHVLERAPAGTPEAVASFLDRVVAARRAGGTSATIAGAILVAPSFSEEALDRYLGLLRASRSSSLRAALDLLTHREGYVSLGGDGLHLLLVEEQDGRRRPLVPEA